METSDSDQEVCTDQNNARKRKHVEIHDDDDGDVFQGNAGWADAMAKVLQSKTKTKGKKSVLLSKAKKDSLISWKVKQTDDIEVIDASGNKVKEVTETKQRTLKTSEERKQMLERKEKKLLWENMCRSKPDSKDKETERQLCSIATRGVVQLFNAVTQHQKDLQEKLNKVGESEVKKEKIIKSVSKGAFLDMLKNQSGSTKVKQETMSSDASTSARQETWNVLRDDFMIGTTMKNWDKESDEEK